MSDFFEQELRRLFEDGSVIDTPVFAGRACLGTLGGDLRVRAQFAATHIKGHYDALDVTILNRQDGKVDSLIIRFLELWGRKPVPGNPCFPDGVEPYIWQYDKKTDWYAFHPSEKDRTLLRQQVLNYLSVYRERTQERIRDDPVPKVVYLCLPMHGDVKVNMEFARQKAAEEFAAGNIPLCPHFLLPQSMRINQSRQVQSAKQTALRMVESCQEVHIYGDEWDERMRNEIRHANELGIKVVTGQTLVQRHDVRGTDRNVSADTGLGNGYAIELELGLDTVEGSVRVKLPAPPQVLFDAVKSLNPPDNSCLTWRCLECKVPALREMIDHAGAVAEVNYAALELSCMSGQETARYETLLAEKHPATLIDAVELLPQALEQTVQEPSAHSVEAKNRTANKPRHKSGREAR